MSRALASVVIFLSSMGSASAQPPGVDEAQARKQKIEAAKAEQRRALRAVLARDRIGEEWVPDARQELESQLATQIADIDRACNLTEPEKKKLQLTGQGDIKRFFDRYEQLMRKKSQVIEPKAQNFQQMQAEAR